MAEEGTKPLTSGPRQNARSVNLFVSSAHESVLTWAPVWRRAFLNAYACGTIQAKCAKNPACKGFNYDNDMGVCRYKKSLSQYVDD